MKHAFSVLVCILVSHAVFAQRVSKVWVADNGDGTYKNPVIHADYSDPDAIRVGNDFYMISSSFNHVPGIPILHSRDLVNWELIGHVLSSILPANHFDTVQHGGGVWAPSIRYHNNEFYIYYPDPDFGIYLTKSKNIMGPWSRPILVQAGKGLIDPCPFWDDDDRVYLVHAFAGSRASIKSIIVIKEMNAEGTSVISNGSIVYDGHTLDPTIEGPKIYKRNGYYYIFAPAGGVSTGWQVVLRSKNIYGPYERRVVLDQGSTTINGPHQGAWVTTIDGGNWFLHFQDMEAYGRVVHLQPMNWKNDWPVIGYDPDGDGKGEPVMKFKKPVAKPLSILTPPDSDEFDNSLGLQWQWQANPQLNWSFINSGQLRLYAVLQPDSLINYWSLPNLLLQKLPAEYFTATMKMSFKPRVENERTGLIMFGTDYALLELVNKNGGIHLQMRTCTSADKNRPDKIVPVAKLISGNIFLRVRMEKTAIYQFSYSVDGINYTNIDERFIAKPGRWVGAKLGMYCTSNTKTNDAGWADIDWFRFE